MCALLLGGLLLPFGIGPANAQFTRFENFTDEQGLGNASVSALAQDADGYVLLGTEGGLYRYDGSNISSYAAAGLPAGAWVLRIAIDQAGRTWVMTTGGLFVRDRSSFRQVDAGASLHLLSPHLLALSRKEIVIDDGGRLKRASLSGQAVGPFSLLFDAATLALHPALRNARFVVADTNGALLIGCGMAICRFENGQLALFGEADGLPADAWQVAARAPDGTLWARSLDRLAWRRPGQASFSVAMVPGQRGHFNVAAPARLDLLPDRRGGVLTQGEEGLLDFDGSTWRRMLHHDGGLSANPVQSLMFDREGSLWVGSVGRGAFRSLGLGTWEHWTTEDGLPSQIVWAITRLRNGQLWVATYGDAVPLDRKAAAIPGGSENAVATQAGRLWLAPLRAPLVRLDSASGKLERFPVNANMSSMYVDAENRLWLSTDRALLKVTDADAPAPAVHPEIALQQPMLQVTADQSGRIWALASRGVFRADRTGRFTLVIPATSLTGQPGGLAFTPDGELWVFTDSAGLLRFRLTGDRFASLPSITTPLLGSNDILFLHRDHRGAMWVGTDHGIDMFDGRSWRRFDATDGLISNDMDQGAVFEDRDGSMWFGTSRGLTHLLDPAHLAPIATLHPFITDLSIGDRHFSPSASIRLDWSSAPLVIRFADLDFTRGHNITFRYRLRGLDSGWNDTAGHDVRYASLPAGRLAFELVAVDAVHGSVSAPVGFTLRIRAPWWRRWWFYGSCVAIIAAAIAGTWQARVRLLVRQRRVLEKLVGERTSEIEQARNELQRLAMSDALTGLANRRAIMGALEEAVASARSSGTPLAVLLCDIDHFKKINDGHGHLAGDAVLSAFGSRLRAVIEPPETAGRYGGEEFCIVLPLRPEKVGERVAAIRSALCDAAYTFGGAERIVTTSGGLAFLRAQETALSLLARADAALYRAKGNGRNRIEPASDDARQEQAARAFDAAVAITAPVDLPGRQSRERCDLERELRAALAGEEFRLQYQPVIDTTLDVVTSCEALLRWHSPTRGRVPPGEFIPFAEEVGLMPDIGDWVLRTACRDAAGWKEPLKISVNLSAVQFRLPDLVARVEAALAATRLPAERLELEVTETAVIDEVEAATSMLEQLRRLGITIALDDFGTGYSSLSFLRTLPFDRIKIDRSFVQDLGTRPEAAVIVRAITGMCVSLGAAVTAEGVETEAQIRELRAAGCREIQGYGIGRPCSASELQAWMAAFAASRTREVGLTGLRRAG